MSESEQRNTFLDDLKHTVEVPECDGHVYRAKANWFINHLGDYVENKRMSRLKKKSCPGCENCGQLTDMLGDEVDCHEYPIDIRPKFVDKGLYKLMVVDQTRDWETGYIDNYSMAFVLMEEKDEQNTQNSNDGPANETR